LLIEKTQCDEFVDCNATDAWLRKGGTARRLVAAFRESVGGGGGTNRTIHGPKKVAHAHLGVKKSNPRGFFPTHAVGEGWSRVEKRNPHPPRRQPSRQTRGQAKPVMFPKLPTSLKIHDVFHVDLLTPYHETEEHGENYTQPPPELIDGEKECQVEEIIDERINRRKKQYLVKWLGYPVSKNSWINAKDLHADELLEEYRLSKL
jgi:hypothetical protein